MAFGWLKKAVKKATKTLDKATQPLQKAVRTTVKAATKGTPLESVGKSLTKVSYKDPIGSAKRVIKSAAPLAAGAIGGPLASGAASALLSGMPKARSKTGGAAPVTMGSAVAGTPLGPRSVPRSPDRAAWSEYASNPETMGGVFGGKAE